jgi:predicted MFS family arabinose efflux permease
VDDTADSSAAQRRIALAALLLGTFMGVVDVFVVVVALPAMRADLGASFGQAQLILAGYAMAYAVGLITGGRLGDLYGRRRVFLAAKDRRTCLAHWRCFDVVSTNSNAFSAPVS